MKQQNVDTPILIVGGGPVGMALAIEMGWRGIAATVLEQGDGNVDHPRLGVILARTMEICRRWGIVDRVYNCGFNNDYHLNVIYCTSMTGHMLSADQNASCNELPPPPQSPVKRQRCPQIWFNPLLERAAAEYSSNNILHFKKLESFREIDGGVESQVVDVNTADVTVVKSQYLVACDGAASTVRSLLGVRMLGNPAMSYSMNLFIRSPKLLSMHDKGEAERYIFVNQMGTWANLTVVDGRELWRITIIGNNEMMDLESFDAHATIRNCLGTDEIPYELISVKPWRRSELTAERMRVGRVFLAGDAAHTMSPTGGNGMSTGVADVCDLGWKMQAVMQGWGGANLLDSYESERRPVAVLMSEQSSKNFRNWVSAERCDDILDETPAGEATRRRVGDHMLKAGREDWDSLGLQLGYRYEPSPICVPDGTVAPPVTVVEFKQSSRAGSRAPHVWMKDGSSTLDLFGKGFVILRFGGEAASVAQLESAAASQGMPLTLVDIADQAIAAVYERKLVLVRPDGFVAWRGDELPHDALALVATICGS